MTARTDAEADEADRRTSRLTVLLDVVLVLVLGWVVWVTVGAQAQKVAAAAGQGRPGVIVIDELRPARGSDIPVGTFTEPDGMATPGVAWQERPAGVGDHLEGVRVGDRAWSPGVRIGVTDVVVVVAVLAILLWRLLALVRHVRQRR